MNKDNTKKESNKKVLIAVVIAVLLLALGFYLYYFYPQIIPGLASTSLKEDVKVLVIGIDDVESVDEGEVSADTVILAQVLLENNEVKLTNIVVEDNSFGETIEQEEIDELMSEVGDMVSVDLDYYFTLSYQGFINLIDNLDGIVITREEELNVPDLNLSLKEGNNQLSGEEALNYARWYDYTKDEEDRIQRQQEIISAIIDKVLVNKSLKDIPQLFTTTVDTFKSVDTNVEYTMVTNIINYLMNNENQKISYDIIQKETSDQDNVLE